MKKEYIFTRSCLVLFISLFLCYTLQAQELEASVTINTPLLQKADPQVFKEMESALIEFINTQQWTEDEFEPEERIQVNLQVNITDEISSNEFKCDILIQSSRPVFGGDYQTVLISHADKGVVFTYEQFQPIQLSRNLFVDNLSSVISFYAYVILGMDYDSFSPFGGDEYFLRAQEILNEVPSNLTSKYKGWRSTNNRSRYWLVENLLNPRVRPLRQSLYDYHRLGLDTMHEDVEISKTVLLNAIEAIGGVNKALPNSMIVQMFANAKSSEIVEVFKKGNSQQKSKVKQLMNKMDASNASKYNSIGR